MAVDCIQYGGSGIFAIPHGSFQPQQQQPRHGQVHAEGEHLVYLRLARWRWHRDGAENHIRTSSQRRLVVRRLDPGLIVHGKSGRFLDRYQDRNTDKISGRPGKTDEDQIWYGKEYLRSHHVPCISSGHIQKNVDVHGQNPPGLDGGQLLRRHSEGEN